MHIHLEFVLHYSIKKLKIQSKDWNDLSWLFFKLNDRIIINERYIFSVKDIYYIPKTK